MDVFRDGEKLAESFHAVLFRVDPDPDRAQAEVAAIVRGWAEAGGSKARLAEILAVSPRTLRYKLAEYDLKLT